MPDSFGRADSPLPAANGQDARSPSGGTHPPDAPTSDLIEALCAAHAPVSDGGHFAAGTVFGDWRVTAFIGRGGNGEVYCAEHVTLGMPAAVKVLMREEDRAKERFVREAKLLAEMRSKAFPRFFAYGEANGAVYLAMELLEPGELPADDRAVAQFMLKVCDAVAELHARGYVHRDIKPDNILWRRGGDKASAVPVLADLGLVKALNSSNSHLLTAHPLTTFTVGGVGTPGYGAPEQMERGEATAVSDIHALGVLADRCFDGKPPGPWKRIIECATSSIPAHRYPSVAALAREICCRNRRRTMSVWFCCMATLLAIGMVLREPAERLWAWWRELRNAPVLDASAVLDGKDANDVRWYLDDKPVAMPYRILDEDGGRRRWMPRRLCAVAHKDGKTYSAKRVNIVPEWAGRRKFQLSLGEDPAGGTPIRIWTPDGTPFDFVWCPPGKDETNGLGFWMAPKRLTGRQYGAFLKEGVYRHTAISSTIHHDLSSEQPIQLEFDNCYTVPVVSVPGFGITLEPPDVLQWRRSIRQADDCDGKSAEWACVPPDQVDGDRRGGGWMKMGGSGEERFIGNFNAYNPASVGTACVRYIAVSRFRNETNTVLYCTAQSLLRSKEREDVAHGEAMLKEFFRSDDMELKMLAMECCIKRGVSTLHDFGGTNAAKRLRFAAISRGDAQVLERLAVDDPDPYVRDEAYAKMSNPPQMASARYVARIKQDRETMEISKPLNVIRSLTERAALDFIVRNANLGVFRDEAQSRLDDLGAKRP